LSEKVGAVLVVGGGVSGIQSALDLADSGFKVYLLEKKPSIGGVMAQLDKTFPTNDCAMCILAPKLVEAGRHHNIELITNTDIEGISGEPGNFEVTVNKRARFVDAEKCTGCGVCTEQCPVRFMIQVQDVVDTPPEFKDSAKIDEIIGKNSHFKEPIIQILIDVNNEFNYLPKEALYYISYKLELPLTQIYEVATFYKAFNFTPRGKYHLKACLGTACHVRGARNIVEKINNKITDSEEGMFSLETVNCLGACALGPIMVVNDETHGHMSVDKVDEVLDALAEEEGE
jgi:NADH:ubiquinone oxidoreductase subunit E